MILSDFLSRQIEDDSNLHEIYSYILQYTGNIVRKLPQHGIRYLQGANKSSGKGPRQMPPQW